MTFARNFWQITSLNVWLSLTYQDKKTAIILSQPFTYFCVRSSAKSLYFLLSWICICSPLMWLFTSFIFYFVKAEMKRFASVDTSVLKQHYEKKVHELEQEKKSLQVSALSVSLGLWFKCLVSKPFSIPVVNWQKEIEELRCNLSNISSTSDDGAQKLKEEYLQKLNVLESQVNIEIESPYSSQWHLQFLDLYFVLQVSVLKKKQDAQAQLLRQKQKSDEAAKRLHDEIQRIKTQKVQFDRRRSLLLRNRYNNNFSQYQCYVVFYRFNCNIRLSKNLSSLGYGRHHEKKKFSRYPKI